MMRAPWTRFAPSGNAGLVAAVLTAVVWAVLMLGVAVPSWRDVRARHAEIEHLERRLADLDRWTVAGLWLEPAVAAREAQVAAAWQRTYPPARDREDLFLRVAEVADRCGVRQFQLEEVGDYQMLDMGTWSTAADGGTEAAGMDAPPTDAPPLDMPMAVAPTLEPVTLTLSPYRVRAVFMSDYAGTSAFLAGVEAIDRAIDVRRLTIRPARTGVDVELEMEVPVSEPTDS